MASRKSPQRSLTSAQCEIACRQLDDIEQQLKELEEHLDDIADYVTEARGARRARVPRFAKGVHLDEARRDGR
jgi:hypothetical protein